MNEYDIQQTFSAAITDTQTFYSMYTITYIVPQNDLQFNAYDSDGTSILTPKKDKQKKKDRKMGEQILR